MFTYGVTKYVVAARSRSHTCREVSLANSLKAIKFCKTGLPVVLAAPPTRRGCQRTGDVSCNLYQVPYNIIGVFPRGETI